MEQKRETPIGRIGVDVQGAMREAISNTYKDSEKGGIYKIFRVENDVYERVPFVKNDGMQRIEIRKRTRKAIAERYGNRFVENTPYYDGFVNIPSHTNYQQVVPNGGNGLYNKYHPLMFQPEQGVHPSWDILIDHIGGEQRDLLWDYLTILYRYPTQILPVLCLASKENGTGKSTFANALGWIFGENVSLLTQTDLQSQFNFWVTKLIAVFEEVSDSKKAINTIKAFSTAKSASLNEKNEKQTNVESFLKILINTNNEDDFIKANNEDIRYWVIRVKPIDTYDPNFDSKLLAEVPAVMWTLVHREISTPKKSRMWFEPRLLKTEALANVVANSRSECAKEILEWAGDKIRASGKGFSANLTDIKDDMGCKYERTPIRNALKELGMTPTDGRYIKWDGSSGNGRYYTFTLPTAEDPEIANAEFTKICEDDANGDTPF